MLRINQFFVILLGGPLYLRFNIKSIKNTKSCNVRKKETIDFFDIKNYNNSYKYADLTLIHLLHDNHPFEKRNIKTCIHCIIVLISTYYGFTVFFFSCCV